MPLRPFQLQPGVNLQESSFLNQLQLTASNLVRFFSKRLQKLGGWARIVQQTFVGTCTGLHGWADILGNAYLAIGTDQRLQLLAFGQIQDITPIVATTNPAVSFSTVINTTGVTITDAGHNPNVGDWINLLTQVSVGGIVLFGFYQVQTVPSGTTFTIAAATPATATVTNGGAVPAYTTTNTQPAVSVALNNHGFVTGQGGIFTAAVSTTVATVVINGNFAVTSVTDANHFVITAGSNANASTTASENAGNARIQYLLPRGSPLNTAQGGYGEGPYGGGPYGQGSGVTTVPGRLWSLDHFGQDLIASPTNGAIYFWQPPTIQAATTVGGSSPLASTTVFVMPQAEIIVALGAEIGGTQQPLLIRWCDVGDFTDWIATAVNQAGSFSLATGSGLVGGIAVGMGALLWTDIGVVAMSYIGFPLVFSFNPIAIGCGMISARAAGNVGPLVMWIGIDQFYQYMIGGGVQPVECSVYDFFFNNCDFTNTQLIHCAVNSVFNEMAWHFPISPSSPLFGANTLTGYVKFNYIENVWDFGLSTQYQRTAWAPKSPVGNPIGADLAGLLQQHEIGRDADVGSSRVDLQACKLEYSIVSPK